MADDTGRRAATTAAWWWKATAVAGTILAFHRGCEIDRLKQELMAARAARTPSPLGAEARRALRDLEVIRELERTGR